MIAAGLSLLIFIFGAMLGVLIGAAMSALNYEGGGSCYSPPSTADRPRVRTIIYSKDVNQEEML